MTLGFESPSLRRLIVLVKILKCLTIIIAILLKFMILKSLKLNKNTEYASEVRQNSHSLFCCLLFVYFHFEERKSTIYLLKTTKIENKSGEEMLRKIIHWSKRFWQEIVFVLIYILCTIVYLCSVFNINISPTNTIVNN